MKAEIGSKLQKIAEFEMKSEQILKELAEIQQTYS
jgi:hypothetical protein